MTIKNVQIIEDDLDGSEGARTIKFGFDGAHYEIDLNDEHASELEALLAPYIGSARRGRGGRGPARRTNARMNSSTPPAHPLTGRAQLSTEKGFSPKEVRQWALANNVDVPKMGRVPNAVVEQYEAAQNTSSAGKKTARKKAASR